MPVSWLQSVLSDRALALPVSRGILAPRPKRTSSMKRIALITLLFPLTSLAQAGSFELSDPANEMIEEEKQRRDEPRQTWGFSANLLCSVETATGDCSCIDKKKAKKLSMTQQECADRVLQALQLNKPR
jgi:hypothetical protein